MPYLRSAGHLSPHIRDAPTPVEGFHGPTGCQPSGRATTLGALSRFHRSYPGTADFGAVLGRSCSAPRGSAAPAGAFAASRGLREALGRLHSVWARGA